MSHILPRGYVELPLDVSMYPRINNYRGLSLIHNHVGDGIDLSRFKDNRKVVNVILKRNHFMSAISLIVTEYTGEYKSYSNKKFDKITVSPERIKEIIHANTRAIKVWKKFKHDRIARTVILDYDDLVNNRWTDVYNKLGIVHNPIHPGLNGLGTKIDIVRKSPNIPSQLVENYEELKRQFK
jgi:hypothetical protein